ncbi:MAG: T9SS type A sorting domain-containing protein [Dysgonomonas sp.]
MKTLICILFFIVTNLLCIRAQINLKHNSIRLGDKIIKQQVEYKEPQEAGKSQVWDFSKLKTINDAYKLIFSSPPIQGDSLYIMGDNHFDVKKIAENELIVGTEHNTMYYYCLRNDSLLLLGHENPSVRLCYTQPIIDMVYPINYGDKIYKIYQSTGLYSGIVNFKTKGSIVIEADAYGKMILPTGDTLNPVLRIKTIKTIYNIPTDSLDATITDDGTQIESYKWYTKGYRYPVFETIKGINMTTGTELFSTAFFFPLQDHLYLETDPANQAILDEIWDLDDELKQGQVTEDPTSKIVSLENLLTCKIYPNPVESTLYLDYELKQDAKVSFELYSIDGNPVRTIAAKLKMAGSYNETMDCSSLQSKKTYILRIIANGIIVNEKIIRK